MKIETVNTMLKTAFLLREMPIGQGWASPATIRQYSGVSNSTTYRYLTQLEKLGYIESKPVVCRKLHCKQYRITNEGVEFIGHYRSLF